MKGNTAVDSLFNLVNKNLKDSISIVKYTGPKKLEGTNNFTFHRSKLGWSVHRGSEFIVNNSSLRYCCISVCDYIDLV